MKEGIRGRAGVCAAVILPALVAGLALALGLPGAATGLVGTTTIPGTESGKDNVDGMVLKCSRSRQAIAGGFAADFRPDGGPQILPTHSGKAWGARTWGIGAENEGPTAGRLTGFAYCRKGRRLMSSRSRFVSEAFPGEQKTLRVRCRRGQGRVVSGGFSLGDGLRIYESRKAHRRAWVISVHNPTAERIAFDGFAYCRPGRDTRARHNAVRVRSGETATVTARCKAKKRLLSGGFANPDFHADGGPRMLAHVSRRVGRENSWRVAAHNAGDAPGMLVAFAYCRGR